METPSYILRLYRDDRLLTGDDSLPDNVWKVERGVVGEREAENKLSLFHILNRARAISHLSALFLLHEFRMIKTFQYFKVVKKKRAYIHGDSLFRKE